MPIFRGFQSLGPTRVQVDLEEDGQTHSRLLRTDDPTVRKSLEALKPGQSVTLITKASPKDEGPIRISTLETISSSSEQKG